MSAKATRSSEIVHYLASTTFTIDKKYSDLKAIGKGSYGVVCSALDATTGRRIAIKKITPMAKHVMDAKHVLREIRLMRHMGKHENIITLEDLIVREAADELYIVMELLDTDLHRVLQSKQQLSESHFKHFLFQLLCGVKYLHENRIIHRDLKPGNLLVTKDCRLRIADFGLARERPTGHGAHPDDQIDEPMTEHVVTRWFRPPELMLCPDGLYTYAVDMWSCGCILGEMLGRKPLFPGKNFVHQLQLIFEVIGSPLPSQVAHITNQQARKFLETQGGRKKLPMQQLFPESSPAALSLMDQFLSFDPEDRVTVDGALASEFLWEVRDQGSKSEIYPPTSPSFEFNFERCSASRSDLKALIHQESTSLRREVRMQGGGGGGDDEEVFNAESHTESDDENGADERKQKVTESMREKERNRERGRERETSSSTVLDRERNGSTDRDGDKGKEKGRDRERGTERDTDNRRISIERERNKDKEKDKVPFKLEKMLSTSINTSSNGKDKEKEKDRDKEKGEVKHITPALPTRKPLVPSFTSRADYLQAQQQQQLETQQLEQQLQQQYLVDQHQQQHRTMQLHLEELQAQQTKQQKQLKQQPKRESRATIPGPEMRDPLPSTFIIPSSKPSLEPVNIMGSVTGSWGGGPPLESNLGSKQGEGKTSNEIDSLANRAAHTSSLTALRMPHDRQDLTAVSGRMIGVTAPVQSPRSYLSRSPVRAPRSPSKLTENVNYDDDFATISALLRSPIGSPVGGQRHGWAYAVDEQKESEAAAAIVEADASRAASLLALRGLNPSSSSSCSTLQQDSRHSIGNLQQRMDVHEVGMGGQSDDSDSEVEVDRHSIAMPPFGTRGRRRGRRSSGGLLDSAIESTCEFGLLEGEFSPIHATERLSVEDRENVTRREALTRQRLSAGKTRNREDLISVQKQNRENGVNPYIHGTVPSSRESEEKTKYDEDSGEDSDVALRTEISQISARNGNSDDFSALPGGTTVGPVGRRRNTLPHSPKFSRMSWQRERGSETGIGGGIGGGGGGGGGGRSDDAEGLTRGVRGVGVGVDGGVGASVGVGSGVGVGVEAQHAAIGMGLLTGQVPTIGSNMGLGTGLNMGPGMGPGTGPAAGLGTTLSVASDRRSSRRKTMGMSTNGSSILRPTASMNQRYGVSASVVGFLGGPILPHQNYANNNVSKVEKEREREKEREKERERERERPSRAASTGAAIVRQSDRDRDRDGEKDRDKDKDKNRYDSDYRGGDIEEAMRLLKARGIGHSAGLGRGVGTGAGTGGDTHRSQSVRRLSARIR